MNKIGEFVIDNNPEMEIVETQLIDLKSYPVKDVLDILLQDKTTKKNIIWATDAYQSHGDNCTDTSRITREAFYMEKKVILQPRTEKALDQQQERTRKKAEVFTPVWLCNKMNNYVDEEWFGRKDVFNHENDDNTWTVIETKIQFPEGKTWKDYVDSRRLEITCGEAPYLVSRYDAATGMFILPPLRRVGILDRKLRIVNENAETKEEWIKWAERAFQSCYGYEWQGDSLLIARINLLMSFLDYYKEKWEENPDDDILNRIANTIAWNLWQMDGLKDTVPFGKPYQQFRQVTLFDSFEKLEKPKEDVALPCKIYDWRRDNSLLFKDCKKRGKMSKKLFDFVIGNPPYQMETAEKTIESTNGQTARKNVFHIMQLTADQLAECTTILIYPRGRWIQQSGKGMAQFGNDQINDPHLSKLYYYPKSKDVFPGITIDDGISIVVKNMKKTDPLFNYIYCEGCEKSSIWIAPPGDTILPLKPADMPICEKIEQFIKTNNLQHLSSRILPQKLFKIESDFISKNSKKVRELTPNSIVDYGKEAKLLANDKAGTAGRSKWYIINKRDIPDSAEYVDKWKVVVSSAHPAGAYGRDNMLEIIDNHSAFGRSRVALGAFDTEEEAKNFYKYVSSITVKYALLMIDEALSTLGSKVPDMGDYTNNNGIIDYHADIDKQLFDLLKLSDDEIKQVKETVANLRGE